MFPLLQSKITTATLNGSFWTLLEKQSFTRRISEWNPLVTGWIRIQSGAAAG
jgi:hypothetical protein